MKKKISSKSEDTFSLESEETFVQEINVLNLAVILSIEYKTNHVQKLLRLLQLHNRCPL